MTEQTQSQESSPTKVSEALAQVNTECANFACLLDLLGDHPVIDEHLSGPVAAIRTQFMTLWENLDSQLNVLYTPDCKQAE